tara:strand:- start:401 stop:1078 length:678 start_codon:yes stop_codon:yes gene_type:complete
MTNKTAIMFSGGVDSTAMLYRQLRDTNDIVYAHHINFINRENRAYCEMVAVKDIVSYLQKNVRKFHYSESTFIWPGKYYVGWDIITAMYIGSCVTGDIIEEDKRRSSAEKICFHYQIAIGDNHDDFGSYQWKSPIAQSIFLTASLRQPWLNQTIPQIIQPIADISKKDLIEDMPQELYNLTWSCRQPVFKIKKNSYVECGKCNVCLDIKKIGHFRNIEFLKKERI